MALFVDDGSCPRRDPRAPRQLDLDVFWRSHHGPTSHEHGHHQSSVACITTQQPPHNCADSVV